MTLLLVVALTILIVGAVVWHRHETNESKIVSEYLLHKSQADFSKLLSLRSEKFRTFVSDYTLWDELYAFPAKPQPKWAHESLYTALTEGGADAYFIVDRSGRVVYGECHSHHKLNDVILPYERWASLFKDKVGPQSGFFQVKEGIIEVHLSTIHRSVDHSRKGDYSGYLGIVKVWKPEYVSELSKWMSANILLSREDHPESVQSEGFTFSMPLKGPNNAPIAYLNVSAHDTTISHANSRALTLTYVLGAFTALVFMFVVYATGMLVCRPLRMISQALKTNDRSALKCLREKNDEFGNISVLIDTVLKNRSELKKRSAELERHVQEQKQQLESERYRDSLTSLANRFYFNEHLLELLNSSDTLNNLGVILMDIDDFQMFNDTHDLSAGDALLCEVADRLSKVAPEHVFVARFGGDEFAMLVPSVKSENEIANLIASLHFVFDAPVEIEGKKHHFSVGMGVANYGDVEIKVIGADIVKKADIALHHAKSLGKGRFAFYTTEMEETQITRASVESNIRQAIEDDEFEVHYQPILNIETGELHAVEALVRWRHPTRGLVSPSEFIPIAEETGLIVPLGYLILHKACQEIGQLWKRHPECPRFVLSVNLSGKQLDLDDVVMSVMREVRETNFPTKYLQLEVTETAMAQNLADSLGRLRELRDLGIIIAIDDFGTGYSSISSLGEMPAHIVKVDMCFVRRLPDDIEAISILRAVASMATSIGLQTVAEGVETPEQLEMLAILGYDYGQGYLFSKTVDLHTLTEMVVDNPESLRDRLKSAYGRRDDQLSA